MAWPLKWLMTTGPKPTPISTERELVTHVYIEAPAASGVAAEQAHRAGPLTYVVDRAHGQYAGGRSAWTETLAYVRQGHGDAGSCVDYVRNTAKHLQDLGIPDPELDKLVQLL